MEQPVALNVAIQVKNSPPQLGQVKWTLWILEDVSPHRCKSVGDSHQSEKRPQEIHTELTCSELCRIQVSITKLLIWLKRVLTGRLRFTDSWSYGGSTKIKGIKSQASTLNRPLHVTEVMAQTLLTLVPTVLLSQYTRRAALTRAGLHRTRVNGTGRDPYMTRVCGLRSPGDHWPIPGQPRLRYTSPGTARDGSWVKWWERAQTRIRPLPLIQSNRMSTSYWQDQIWSPKYSVSLQNRRRWFRSNTKNVKTCSSGMDLSVNGAPWWPPTDHTAAGFTRHIYGKGNTGNNVPQE